MPTMKAFLSDMDGVMYRGATLIPGADIFVDRLRSAGARFLFLTNHSGVTPEDLAAKLDRLGIPDLEPRHFLTAARTAALFVSRQKPGARCHVLGEPALSAELEAAGLVVTDKNPEYVVAGKTRDFDFDSLKKAATFLAAGARFIGTNPDKADPVEDGLEPAAGAILAALEAATGKKPFVVGKPNALMMLIARQQLESHSSETVMIGDRMDTDIVAGLEAGMTTCLVLSGVTRLDQLEEFAYRPDQIYDHVGLVPVESL
jgi:NagD protein